MTLLYYQPAALGDESGANLQLYSVMQVPWHPPLFKAQIGIARTQEGADEGTCQMTVVSL